LHDKSGTHGYTKVAYRENVGVRDSAGTSNPCKMSRRVFGHMDRSIIGLDKYAINTPALLIDLDKMEHNVRKMGNFFRKKQTDLRPHIKTHKTPILAHKQLEAGAVGITCQKLAEAEIMANSGIGDILIANQIVGDQKIRRLVNLAKWVDIKVAVDNPENVKAIGGAAQQKGVEIGILVEVNIGMDRCGVSPGEKALQLAREIERQNGLKFLGLMGYEAHTVFLSSYEERKLKTKEALGLLIGTKRLIEKSGIECRVLSAGGTGTYDITGSYPEVTEVQAGSYITMDTKYRTVEGIGGEFKQALTLLATVVSRPTEHRAVIDAGMKSITHEFGMPELDMDQTGVQLDVLAEEHGILRIENPTKELDVGKKIELIPSHGCTTINLHDYFYGIRDGLVECIWPIEARGKFG
jgi:D-serine deaminase-like pyridoxal phosphate-dependent protein